MPDSAEPFSAAGIGTGTRSITGLWQFHLGDDLAWAQPGFDDRSWERLPADQPWGDVGHPGYSGFAWYRREITLDPANKKPLALLLPPVNSVAEVYWNGVKAGGVGTPPPHAVWPRTPVQVAVPLPSTPGARQGELAIRVWGHRLGSNEPPDLSGFRAMPQVGYRPLIEKMPQQSVEHRFRTRAVSNVTVLLSFFVAIGALVLWARSRSHWLLLSVAVYLGLASLMVFSGNTPMDALAGVMTADTLTWAQDIAFLSLALLISDLPSRPGVRGARFWWRVSLAFAAIYLAAVAASVFGFAMTAWNTHLRLFLFLDKSTEFVSFAYSLYIPVLLGACFLLSRLSVPRRLLLVALSLDYVLKVVPGLFEQQAIHIQWVSDLIHRPFMDIYGGIVTIYSVDRIIVLLAIIYAVSDQIGRQVARQRFVDGEMKAAQEIQEVLVPAAGEREAPGFAVSSIYRPASEVGGDFFQIIPLDGDGTLIVAGDVSGKGLRAAMTVSLVVGTLRTLAETDPSPVAVLAGLNRRLLGRTQGGFVTCCAVLVDPSGSASMANAGHCQPYLDAQEIELPNGLPLGIVAGAEYEERSVRVSHGQQLTLLSDGIVEARNRHGELYGFDRLNQLMQQRPTAEHIADTAVIFGQDDDITVLTVTRLAPA